LLAGTRIFTLPRFYPFTELLHTLHRGERDGKWKRIKKVLFLKKKYMDVATITHYKHAKF
jgi:hypothetical protein